MSDSGARADNSLWQLVTVRFKEYTREPEALFWSFGFPILLAIGLGIAFRSKPADTVHVAVADTGPGTGKLVDAFNHKFYTRGTPWEKVLTKALSAISAGALTA